MGGRRRVGGGQSTSPRSQQNFLCVSLFPKVSETQLLSPHLYSQVYFLFVPNASSQNNISL